MASAVSEGAEGEIGDVNHEKVELIWQMCLSSLGETDNELRLPISVYETLTPDEIAVLKYRLSEYLQAPVVSFNDTTMNVYRVLRMPEMRTPSTPAASTSPFTPSSTASSPSANVERIGHKARPYGKKARIPRPPNAFILYRQTHHPILKSENPDLHNNDISVILGHQWKNEDEVVRDKFKLMADELKRQHYIKFPDYQYSPRKASEKKRRMTARKLANMHQAAATSDVVEFPAVNGTQIGPNFFPSLTAGDGVGTEVQADQVPSIDNILALNTISNQQTISIDTSDDMMSNFNMAQVIAGINAGLNPTPDPAQDLATVYQPVDFLSSVVDFEALQGSTTGGQTAETSDSDVAEDVAQIQNNHPVFEIVQTTTKDAFDAELEYLLSLIG